MDKKDWCQDCMRWREIYPEQELHHRALFEYNLFAKEWMERFKFRGDVRIVKMLVPYVAKELKEYKQTHLIVPMPIRTSSLEERGFNQVEVILKEVGIAYCEALKHQLSGKKQSQKNKKERLNSPQPFCWIDGKQEQFFGKRVLVVDDVYTTGRTMLYAVQLLEEAKAERIDTLSIFR
jgi:competence protein ComFC